MVSVHDLWDLVIEELKKEVPYVALRTWFDDIEVIALQERTLCLYSPVEFKRETIGKYYSQRLGKVLRGILSETVEIKLLSAEEYREHQEKGIRRLRSLRECGEYTFEHFVVGPSNRLAYAAARAVAAEHSRYNNPLVIYGASGLGKTHLLNAIADAVERNNPDASVIYVKGENFTHELIEAIANEQKTQFRNKYRGAEYFLMDDIQFIAGKKQTQEEFFNTFERLYEANCQIVLTMDQPLNELTALQERIRNRFEGGLLVEIEAPDFETRCAIVRSKAERRDIVLGEEDVDLIARQITSDVRKLEGALNKVKALRALSDQAADNDAIAIALRSYRPKSGKRVAPQDVVAAVAARMHVDVALVIGQSRTGRVTRARQIAMYLLCEVHGLSTTVVGRFFGRDHSTVVYAIGKVGQLLIDEPAIRDLVEACPNRGRKKRRK